MAFKEENHYEIQLDEEEQKEVVDRYGEYLDHCAKQADSISNFQKGVTAAVGVAIVAGIFREPIAKAVTTGTHKVTDFVRTKIFKKEAKWAKPSSDEDIVVDATVTDVKED